jgi:hypothetical protein
MLGESGLLDFIDYIAFQLEISLGLLREMGNIPEFNAAICGYRSPLAGLTLGYSAFFCWPKLHASFKQLTEEKSLDHVRVAAYCSALEADEKRHIDLDQDNAHERFPELFGAEKMSFAGSERPNYISALLAEIGSFAGAHAFRSAGFSSVRTSDEDAYISYWLNNSEQEISRYLENPRFMAGLDAFSQEILSFHGLLEKVFGLDYYRDVLQKNRYALFRGLRSDLTGRVLVKLAREVQSGRRPVAPDLRSQFPDMYERYQPELYGARPDVG